MTDRDALLQCVLDAPDEDGPRLVLADFLEEAGEVDRGEFIRVQIRLAGLDHDVTFGTLCVDGQCQRCDEQATLRRRERELLVHRLTWLPPACMALESQRAGDACQWRRGFVESIACTLGDWLEHGPAVVQCQPVREVRVTDREPANGPPTWGWWNADAATTDFHPASNLPGELWRLLPGGTVWGDSHKDYDTEADALSALSAACIAWAKAAVTTTARTGSPRGRSAY